MKKYTFLSRTFLIILGASTMLYLTSCSKKFAFAQSSVVPAATGSVKVKKDDNSNYKIEVDVLNLATPDRLQPPRSSYVVWMETERNGVQNLGQVTSDNSFLSKRLKASLNAVSPYKPTRVFITAENDAAIQYPGALVVLSTDRLN